MLHSIQIEAWHLIIVRKLASQVQNTNMFDSILAGLSNTPFLQRFVSFCDVMTSPGVADDGRGRRANRGRRARTKLRQYQGRSAARENLTNITKMV